MSNPPAADAEAEGVSADPAALRASDAPAIADTRPQDSAEPQTALPDDAASSEVAPQDQRAAERAASKPEPDASADGAAVPNGASIATAEARTGVVVALPIARGRRAEEGAGGDANSEGKGTQHAGTNGAATMNGASNGHHGPLTRLIEMNGFGAVSAQQPLVSPVLSANVSPILSALDDAERAESETLAIDASPQQVELDLTEPDDEAAPSPAAGDPDAADGASEQGAPASIPLAAPPAADVGEAPEPDAADPFQPAVAEAKEVEPGLAHADAPPTLEALTPSEPEAPAPEPQQAEMDLAPESQAIAESAPEAQQAETETAPELPRAEVEADPEPQQAETERGREALPREPLAVQNPAISGAFDAASKLVAEASAAAEALENLKRLLERRMPDLAASASLSARLQAPLRDPEEKPLMGPPPPLPLYPVRSLDGDLPALRPAQPRFEPPVPLVPEERRRPDVRGFLAGFALSWAIGAALYIYLTAG
jgi:hypothetical protein